MLPSWGRKDKVQLREYSWGAALMLVLWKSTPVPNAPWKSERLLIRQSGQVGSHENHGQVYRKTKHEVELRMGKQFSLVFRKQMCGFPGQLVKK